MIRERVGHRDHNGTWRVSIDRDHSRVPIYERPGERGARRGRYLVHRTASDLLNARRAAGMSQRELGRQLRISHTKIGRAERGEPGQLTIELAAAMAAVLGLQFNATLHPDGDPVRDAAHVALLARFRSRLSPDLEWRTEVQVPIEGDRRSADAVVGASGVEVLIEAETRIDDVQALEHKISAKQRDMGIGRAILLVADTRHHRALIAHVPELRSRFPVSMRACFAALAKGLDPGGDALVII